MNIENELKNKEILYLKLVSGEDVFAMVQNSVLRRSRDEGQNEVLDFPERVTSLNLHRPFVHKSMMPSSRLDMQSGMIEYATRWCPYADSYYNDIIPIPTSAVITILKPEDDMIARYLDWISEEQEQPSEKSEKLPTQISIDPNRKLH